jgi:peptidoglycan/LPS O-acetylase OafA/YrhL
MRGKSYKETVLASIGVFLLLPLLAWWIYSLLGIQASIHPFIRSNYPSGLMNFPVGVLFAAFFAIGRGSKKLAKIGYLGLLMIMFSVVECAFCFSKTADMSTSPRVLMMLASGGCLFFVFDQSTTAVRYLCMPWLRWLGMISYEWYLLHLPIFHLLWDGKTGGDPLKYLWIVVASGGGSLLLGAFMYRYFSLPILKWARGKASAR